VNYHYELPLPTPPPASSSFISTYTLLLLDNPTSTNTANIYDRIVENRFYSLKIKRTLKLIEFLEEMYDYKLNSLKGYVEKISRR
jgi:hypothetical protein